MSKPCYSIKFRFISQICLGNVLKIKQIFYMHILCKNKHENNTYLFQISPLVYFAQISLRQIMKIIFIDISFILKVRFYIFLNKNKNRINKNCKLKCHCNIKDLLHILTNAIICCPMIISNQINYPNLIEGSFLIKGIVMFIFLQFHVKRALKL